MEIVAQDGSPMDREVQHECSVSHKRNGTQLGRACGQNGLLGDLREGLEMSGTSVVKMATGQLERSREGQMCWPTPTAFQKIHVGGHGGGGGFQVF